MSVDDRIANIEKKQEVTITDVRSIITETRGIYRDVRRIERTANQTIRFMNLMGAALPGLAVLGPYGFAIAFALNIANMVLQIIQKEQEKQQAREREVLRQEIRRELVVQVKGEVEARRREQYRTVVP